MESFFCFVRIYLICNNTAAFCMKGHLVYYKLRNWFVVYMFPGTLHRFEMQLSYIIYNFNYCVVCDHINI